MEVTGMLHKDPDDGSIVEICGVVGLVLSSISWLMFCILCFLP